MSFVIIIKMLIFACVYEYKFISLLYTIIKTNYILNLSISNYHFITLRLGNEIIKIVEEELNMRPYIISKGDALCIVYVKMHIYMVVIYGAVSSIHTK